jgi:uncharacterized protein (TIGR04222 family)
VTPSEQVDQAWHLHLTYTKSYWERFCPDVLGMPLHHNPTQGGSAEQDKFVLWYNKTLESYRWFFREQPPADVWPDAMTRFGEDVAFCRVNTQRHWIIPKPRLKWLSAAAVAPVLGVVLAAGCIPTSRAAANLASPSIIAAEIPDPFRLAGPQFLGYFAVVLVAATVLAWIIRCVFRRAADDGFLKPSELDPYEVAYLAGGRKATIDAAIASLASQSAVAVDAVNHRFTRLNGASAQAHLHPVENAILRATDSGIGTYLHDLHDDYGAIDKIADDLRSRGLIVSRGRSILGRMLAVLVMLTVVAFGVTRIVQGISRDKPVAYLVIACFATVVLAFVAFGRRLHRTHRGECVLKDFKSAKASLLPADGQVVRHDLAGRELALALGLFGVGILATGPLTNLHTALRPTKGDAGSGWGGSSWSCGGGCGGGGGGGGCGGGGCGGCGGCGG